MSPFIALLASCLAAASPAAASDGLAQRQATGPSLEALNALLEDPCEHDLCGKAHAARFLPPGEGGGEGGGSSPREALSDTDLQHCNLDVELNAGSGALTGSNTMTVRSLVDGLTQFTFRLRSNMTVTAVTLNGTTNVPVGSLISTGVYGRIVPLDRAYNTDEVFTLRIDYTGTPASMGFGSYNRLVLSDGNVLIFTLSEPYYAATWFPVKDGDALDPGDNGDKFTLELAVTAPSTMRTVSNGLLQGIDALSGDRSRYRWASNYPISTYLVCFSSATYNTWTQTYTYPGGTMPVEFNVVPTSDSAGNRQAWDRSVTMLSAFRPAFGEYPFVNEKYGIYYFGFGGGMEHQTNTGQGTFNESVTAHELAHQWWGDMITCRTWHDIWLNEGFATFGEAIWYENRPGSAGLPDYLAHMYNRRPGAVNGSVYVYDTSSVSRIYSSDFSYRKAGWVLHMLRHVVGDATFFQILADYRTAFEFGAATTDDFAAVASSTAGRDLTYFFDQWVYQVGAPNYLYAWQTFNDGANRYLRLYVNQNQNASWPTFRMPVDVRVNLSGGGNVTRVIENDARTEHYVIPIPAAATGVSLDEFMWILETGRTEVAWVNGPPKVIRTVPAINAEFLPGSGPSQASVVFSEPVTTTAANYTVTGPSGAVPFTLSYTAGSLSATLDFGSPLADGLYTLAVHDTVVSAAASIRLDGEITSDAVYSFRVHKNCPGDLDGDWTVSLSDLTVMLSHFGTASGATPADGDLDGDSDVDLSDLALLLAAFGAAC
ncbi:MAG: Ig-like domain-containing protein [Planctomycetes bacterium]|nr:Ig-like domain-containing protein [Planctomycetota bacterium]